MNFEAVKWSVGFGPKNGVEYRAWKTEDTYKTVSRYVAFPNLSAAQKQWAIEQEELMRVRKQIDRESRIEWRSVISGKMYF